MASGQYVRKGPFSFVCGVCNKNCLSKVRTAKYCSPECRQVAYEYKSRDSEDFECAYCGDIFQSKAPNAKYCTKDCSNKSVKERYINQPRKFNKPTRQGCYVYAWLDDGDIFYIGRGTNDDRVTISHTTTGGQILYCEKHRRSIGAKFSYKIIKSGLTDSGAKLVESVLIDLFRPMCNIAVGSTVEMALNPQLEI